MEHKNYNDFPNRERPSVKTAASSFPRFVSKPQAVFRLFCFPYAGANAVTVFRPWSQKLPSTIEVCPVQLPGRGFRVSEPLLVNLVETVRQIGKAVVERLDKPFAFFGHSMGALLAFELARLLRREWGITPQQLIVSGRMAPQIADPDPPTYDLPEREFFEDLQRRNGTPTEVFQHSELMKVILPILRADFKICQTYVYVEEPPLICPITVLGGLTDEVTREELERWKAQTTGRFRLHMLPGDHFFINTQMEQVLSLVMSQLMSQASNDSQLRSRIAVSPHLSRNDAVGN